MASTEADVFDRLGRGLSALGAWIDDRFPMTKLIKEHATEYYASKNFNFWYGFGVIATFVLVLQLVTGIFLTMNYKPAAADAFASVEYIMRDVEWGWLIRYLHSTGASAFFIVVYLHMFRGLLYGSYKKPRELVWIIGMFIYLSLMAEAFFGYLLPWGNMSYWGAQVIVSLFGAVPVIGNDLAEWIRGDFYISDITLNRFFAFHVIAVPLMLVLLVVVHIMALHEVGSNNPDGIEIKEHKGPGRPSDRRRGVPPVSHEQGLGDRHHLLDPVLGGRVLRAGHGRLLPRARELRAGRSAAHAGAHRAGVVLHAVLRDLARRSEQAARRRPDGSRRDAAVLPAVARSLPREVDPLSQLGLQSRADDVRDYVRCARLPRLAAARPTRSRRCRWFSRSCISRSSCSCRSIPASRKRSRCRRGLRGEKRRHRRSSLGMGSCRRLAAAQHEAALDDANNNVANTASLQARREVLRELLPGLPFREVRALQPARAKTCSSASSSSSTT